MHSNESNRPVHKFLELCRINTHTPTNQPANFCLQLEKGKKLQNDRIQRNCDYKCAMNFWNVLHWIVVRDGVRAM